MPLPRKIDASLAKFLLVSFIPVKEVSVFSCEKGQSFYLGVIHNHMRVEINKIEDGRFNPMSGAILIIKC